MGRFEELLHITPVLLEFVLELFAVPLLLAVGKAHGHHGLIND